MMMGDLLFSVSVLAQSNLITGKVIDNASEPIIGASIQSSVVGKGSGSGRLWSSEKREFDGCYF